MVLPYRYGSDSITKEFPSGDALLRLARRTQLRHLRALAVEALAAYGLEPNRLRLLRYEDNAVYLVEARGERFSLRMSLRDGRTVAEQHSELFWLREMAGHGLVRVPEPVETAGGESVSQVSTPLLGEPSTVVLFRWIPGRIDPSYERRGVAEELGRVTARLHREADAADLPPEFTRPSWGLVDLFDRGAALNDPQAIQMIGDEGVAIVREVGERLGETLPRGAAPKDWGLIHADLHSENLVLGADGEIAVIDFDDCGFGHYMLDVATVLASMYRRGRDRPGAYRRFAHRYLGGYERERALPEAFGQLEAFLIMRDMVILNFVTHSRNPTVAEWGPGRARGIVDEMRRHLDGRPYPGALTR